ncbi:MAG: S-methyl-5-thioribose-1-phosphate isomerase [Bacillota bacterium]
MNALQWTGTSLRLLDQTKLPHEITYVECQDYQQVADAIRNMTVRGAPAIGVSAAYGLVLAAQSLGAQGLKAAADALLATRPTAVNLRWAIERMLQIAADAPEAGLVRLLNQEADRLAAEDVAINRAIGRHGAKLVPDKAGVLTHCNAGALATVGYGTALGVIRAATEAGKQVQVYAGETRPYLQGSRLTAFELMQDNIPVTLITDSMAGFLMAQGKVDLVVVGADRVTANGDVANKIGTYTLAVLAKEHGLPFYVACPLSTMDLSLETGDQIPIEERSSTEVANFRDLPLAPIGVQVWNPAFDVTPHRLVTALITEQGVIYPPYGPNLRQLFN